MRVLVFCLCLSWLYALQPKPLVDYDGRDYYGKRDYGKDALRTIKVQVTCYTPHDNSVCARCTASGEKAKPYYTMAVSRDLDYLFKRRAIVHLSSRGFAKGFWRVHDRMHSRWSKRVDIFVKDAHECRKFGIQSGYLTIYSR